MNGAIATGGVTLHAEELLRGPEPALVLLHGYGDTLDMWREPVRRLSSRQRAIAFDMRGHGDSTWPADGDYSLSATARDLAAVVDAFGVRRPIVGGHSTGGMTALAYAAAHAGRAAGLLLLDIDPFTFKDGLERLLAWRGPETAPSLEDLARLLRAAGDRRPIEAIRAWLAPRTRRAGDGAWTWKQDPRLRPAQAVRPAAPPAESEVRELLERVRCPVLLLRGTESRACSRASLDRSQASLTHAPSRRAEIAAAGHDVLGEAPTAVAAEIDRFLAENLG